MPGLFHFLQKSNPLINLHLIYNHTRTTIMRITPIILTIMRKVIVMITARVTNRKNSPMTMTTNTESSIG